VNSAVISDEKKVFDVSCDTLFIDVKSEQLEILNTRVWAFM